jgi:hypothetical protein
LSRKSWKGLCHENQHAKKHLQLFGIHDHLILLVLPTPLGRSPPPNGSSARGA